MRSIRIYILIYFWIFFHIITDETRQRLHTAKLHRFVHSEGYTITPTPFKKLIFVIKGRNWRIPGGAYHVFFIYSKSACAISVLRVACVPAIAF